VYVEDWDSVRAVILRCLGSLSHSRRGTEMHQVTFPVTYVLRTGVRAAGLPFCSMFPVSSATRALILATRDSIAGNC